MGTVSVKLSRTYTAHEDVFDTIVLREPTYKDICMSGLGKPQELQHTPSGPMVATYSGIIDAYVQRLLKSPGYECIGQLSAHDTLALEKEVCGFFLVSKISPPSPDTSSSEQGSKPQPSSE